ncbi:MAG: hypothetical protein ABJK59_13330 [Erythrobacter sp.]|uniref:hypothetical protein n=1 Tax=Erythrobacter sp. TaxID=1042 RepID=UPI003298E60A
MRIALVSANERTRNGELRAAQELAGRSVLEWQVDLALKLSCERVICLCMTPASELIIAQQQRVEGAGASFHALRNHLQLTNLVRDEDQLFVQLDGLIIDQDALDEDLEPAGELQNTIFELSADHPLSTGYPSDFQRIDKETHWGGVAVLPGDSAVALKEMPDDADAVSVLLRVGLQSRVPRENVPVSLLENNQWILASDSESLELRGKALMEANLPHANWAGPGSAIATSIIRLTPGRWFGAGSEISAGLGIAGLVIAAGLAGIGYDAAAIALASMSAFAAALSNGSAKLRSGVSAQTGVKTSMGWMTPMHIALVCLVLVIANLKPDDWQVSVSIPLFAIGLSYLAGDEKRKGLRPFWRDTTLHLAFFAVCTAFGHLQTALLAFSLVALLQLLLRAPTK